MKNEVTEFSNEELIKRIYGTKIDCRKASIEKMVNIVKDVKNPESLYVNGVAPLSA